MGVPSDEEFEPLDIDRIKLEEVRAVMAALAARLDLRLEKREVFYGEPEYRFVGTR